MLTEEGIEAKKRPKKAENLHRTGLVVQILTFLNPRRSGKFASEGSKKADFRARITLQDELFLVVILNTILGVVMEETGCENRKQGLPKEAPKYKKRKKSGIFFVKTK